MKRAPLPWHGPLLARLPFALAGILLSAGVLPTAGCGPPRAAEAPASAFAMKTDRGGLVEIPVAGAEFTVLEFWSTHCVPCREAVPAVHARRGEVESRGGVLWLVGALEAGELSEQGRTALAGWGVQAPFLVDMRGQQMQQLVGRNCVPWTVVIDPRGAVLWQGEPGPGAQAMMAALP